MQSGILRHLAGCRHPDPVAIEPAAPVPHHPGRIVGVAPLDRPQRLGEGGHHLLVTDQEFVDRRQVIRLGHHGRGEPVLQTRTAGQVGDQRRGQQPAVLDDVDPPIREPALVTQPVNVELDVLARIPTGDEVHCQGVGRQLVTEGARRGHETLRHHLAAEGTHRVLAGMAAGEGILIDPGQVEDSQQLVEIGFRHSVASR